MADFADTEIFRAALEFRYTAVRIWKRLSPKRDAKHELITQSASVLDQIVVATETSGAEAREAFLIARVSCSACRTILERLRTADIGGSTDVSATLELLERVNQLLSECIEKSGVVTSV